MSQQQYDCVITNGILVTANEILPAGLDIGIKDGKIAAIGHNLATGQMDAKVIDAEGAYITPDSHTHIQQDNMPTGDTWESASRSGTTTVLAFAGQKRHETSVLDQYHAKANGQVYCDYGFHLVEILQDQMSKLVNEEGITSVKLYMTYEPYKLNDGELLDVMLLGMTTMIHAENSDMIALRLEAKGNTDPFFHAVARPRIAEDEASYRAISLAELIDAPILLVHMSSESALEHVMAAQARLLPTCPHYLFLLSEEIKQCSNSDHSHGTKFICAPPLRHHPSDLEGLWRGLANGAFTVWSSDHAATKYDHPLGKKAGIIDGVVRFSKVPNGLPGLETRMALLFNQSEACLPPEKARITLPQFVKLTASNAAKLYGMDDRKGTLMAGFDADLVIWYPPGDPRGNVTISQGKLHHGVDYTPFEGLNWPRYTILRGNVVWQHDGAGIGFGQFLRRNKGKLVTGRMGQQGRVSGTQQSPISILLINPNSSPHITNACLQNISSKIPPGVTVYGFTAPPPAPSAIEGRVDGILSSAECLRKIVPIKHRFDAFLVACFSNHPLITALREEVEAPVLGIMESALYAARMCGNKLGVITTSERSEILHAQTIYDAGLANYSAGCAACKISVLDLENKPKEEVFAGVTRAAKELVDGRKADCLLLGCAGMTGAKEACEDAVGTKQRQVMVVDGVAVGVQFLIGLVREGLGTAKSGAYRPAEAVRKARGQEWY
ncbi:LOW QUALITY PROTEIN: hypothetical protein J3E72DRAFT_441014 [Bipolaris maydis]|nr:LOW QUALITY PROTEIN: hypothetical protein J3E72DRAFT_441014 [Bipolaris maydis]